MGLIDRVKNILLHPSQEWGVIEQESSSAAELYSSYVAPLAAIGPLALIIGFSAIEYAVVNYVLALAGVYVLALIIDALASSFQGKKK
ncbi:MAG TPA: YIP1 family protein [Candidatus Binatia bacterium]|nr:YIP1 family protein [Candidatus Binatia bacterium]